MLLRNHDSRGEKTFTNHENTLYHPPNSSMHKSINHFHRRYKYGASYIKIIKPFRALISRKLLRNLCGTWYRQKYPRHKSVFSTFLSLFKIMVSFEQEKTYKTSLEQNKIQENLNSLNTQIFNTRLGHASFFLYISLLQENGVFLLFKLWNDRTENIRNIKR